MQAELTQHPEVWVYGLLFFVAVIAGLVDAIAGGGGLITVPSLLLAGLPPMTALGTNRLQAVIGELTAALVFLAHRKMPLDNVFAGIVWTALGALAGSYSVSLVDATILKLIIPVLMVCITLYSVSSKKLTLISQSKPRLRPGVFMALAGATIGFYNGFFGPGTGSLWMLVFVVLLGYTIQQATMATKPVNLTGNAVSLIFFVGIGQVDFVLGLLMGTGQIAGALVGGKVVLVHGHKVVRPIFICVTLAMTGKLLYENAETFGQILG